MDAFDIIDSGAIWKEGVFCKNIKYFIGSKEIFPFHFICCFLINIDNWITMWDNYIFTISLLIFIFDVYYFFVSFNCLNLDIAYFDCTVERLVDCYIPKFAAHSIFIRNSMWDCIVGRKHIFFKHVFWISFLYKKKNQQCSAHYFVNK